jgi:pimeloyl-ACP methyl ester carboxylesterase
MKSGILHAIERVSRYALNRRGFESRTVPTDTAPLHAYDARGFGSLPPTLVLHGIGSGATSFGPTLARLRPEVRRLVALDLPGHGFSGDPTSQLTPEALYTSVRSAFDHLMTEPMVLVGNSLGGAVAIRYALERPERLVALVLISPAGARTTEEEWSQLVRLFHVESSAEARHLLARLYHRVPWYMPAFAPAFRDRMKQRAIRDILETATDDDLPPAERLGKLTMPVLLLWGRSERVLPPSYLDYFRRNLPKETVIEEPPGFGHCPHFDDPARLADRILEFVRKKAAISPAPLAD